MLRGGEPGENTSEQAYYDTGQELNPGNISGRRVLSPLCQPWFVFEMGNLKGITIRSSIVQCHTHVANGISASGGSCHFICKFRNHR